MSDSIEGYLERLEKELRGCDRATIQDALSDVEEHLRTAFEELREAQPEISEADALAAIIQDFGTPEEAAEIYKAIEKYLQPVLSHPWQSQMKSRAAAFFGIIADPRAWGALLYFMSSILTGFIYFSWAVVGTSLSLIFGLLIIGLPFSVLFLLSVRGIALLEGRIVEALLGYRMPRRLTFFDRELGLWARFKGLVTDLRVWITIGFMFLQLFLGMIYFTAFGTFLGVSLAFLLAPIIRLVIEQMDLPVVVGQSGIVNSIILPSPPVYLPLYSLLGFLMLILTMHLAKLIGRLHGKMAKIMLVRK
jgi:uncharacterized membrane protein